MVQVIFTDNLVLDGIKPFDDIVFFEYEGTVGQSNIVLNGTDSSGSNSDDNVITEDGFKITIRRRYIL